jgi:hypothetical protein
MLNKLLFSIYHLSSNIYRTMANNNFFSLLLIAVLWCSPVTESFPNPAVNVVKWIVGKSSSIRVDGKSNINNFTCNINQYAEKDTIICINNTSESIRLSGELKIAILNFDCHSNLITKDLRKTLKATVYPKMIIRFISLQSMPMLQNKTQLIKGWLEVELAGVVKQFQLTYSFSGAGSPYVQLNGGRSFCFSDFKLSPPRKLAGLVKIKDEFFVNFQLNLQKIAI